jgi:hypothetical protein
LVKNPNTLKKELYDSHLCEIGIFACIAFDPFPNAAKSVGFAMFRLFDGCSKRMRRKGMGVSRERP